MSGNISTGGIGFPKNIGFLGMRETTTRDLGQHSDFGISTGVGELDILALVRTH
jgi:hypothetical protein